MLKSHPFFIVMLLLPLVTPTVAPAQGASADERARATEQQMTDDERFSLLISLSGAPRLRDQRFPAAALRSAGYTPGVPRLGVPALQSSDASMGVTNPGYPPRRQGRHGASRRPSSSARASTRGWRAKGGAADRPRGADAGIQRHAGRRDQSRPRRAQRPELRVLLRGPAGQRRPRRRGGQRHPGRGRHLDAQALHAQLQRNQPPLAGRDHRPRRAPRVRPARVPDRDRALAARRDHERLQQGQRRVCRRAITIC